MSNPQLTNDQPVTPRENAVVVITMNATFCAVLAALTLLFAVDDKTSTAGWMLASVLVVIAIAAFVLKAHVLSSGTPNPEEQPKLAQPATIRTASFAD